MSPASPTPMTNQDSYGGVAGQNLAILKHLQQLLAPVEGLRCTDRLHERCSATQNLQGNKQESRWVALKSAILVLHLEAGHPPHVAAHAPTRSDELSPVVSPSAPLCPCELVGGTTSSAPSWRCSGVTGGGSSAGQSIDCMEPLIRTPVCSVLNQ